MNSQPLPTRGVGITIKPERGGFWLAKAPLWVIAISLFTIAGCLVWLVIRPAAQNKAAAARSATDEVKTADDGPIARGFPRFRNSRSEDETFLAHRDSANTIAIADQKGAAAVDTMPALTPQPTLLAINSRTAGARSALLYSTQYQNGIRGTVRLKGEPPPETSIDNINVPCAEPDQIPRSTRSFVMDTNSGLADALVFLSDGINNQVFAPAETPVELVFTNCLIEPYVSAIMSKQRLSVRDATGLAHHLKISLSKGDAFYESDLKVGGTDLLTKHLNLGTFQRLSCDVHPWEFAYVSVLSHPFFAITDEHGEFSITNIPPGQYTIEVKHRSGSGRGLEQARKSARLSPGSFITVDFAINAPAH